MKYLKTAKRILKYLKTTSNYGICYNGNDETDLMGYADANWAADIDTRKSTTGYVFKYCGGVISWKSTRQQTVATSTTEAEYMALYSATQEAIWLRRLFVELKIMKDKPIKIHQDNQGCIALSKNHMCQQRTKHIDIKYHFVREKVQNKEIELEYLPTTKMIADTLTKNLPRKTFEIYRSEMGLQRMEHEEQDANQSECQGRVLKY